MSPRKAEERLARKGIAATVDVCRSWEHITRRAVWRATVTLDGHGTPHSVGVSESKSTAITRALRQAQEDK